MDSKAPVATPNNGQKVKFSVAIKAPQIVKLMNDTLGDPKVVQTFVADISGVVAQNKQLQECDPFTIISSGLQAQSTNLSLSPTLGFCHILPFKNKGIMEATFQIGWKGLIQLAQRTGLYSTIGVRVVHEGELAGQDEFGEDLVKFDHKYDKAPVIGYYSYFKLINGFKKTIYWTKEQCEAHGSRYSSSHRGDNKGGKFDRWTTDFDDMALKTVLKQLVSKWGPMSIEMQNVIQADQSVIRGNGVFDYVDNDAEEETVKTNVSNTIPDVSDDGEVIR